MKPTSCSAPIRVLVVDDHEMVAESMRRLLEDEDDIVVTGIARSAAEAKAAAWAVPPDVVLMDFGLPDEDGITAAAAIRSRLPQTRVLIWTGGNEDVAVAALEAGCDGYFEKSEPSEKLVTAIRAVHRGETAISSDELARLLSRLRPSHRDVGDDLTARELDVLRLLAEGTGNKEIAQQLSISLNTVRNHVQSILTKLGAHSKLEAVMIAARAGIVPTERRRREA
jgi:DNA-binding NarL/FixJ family response regulator